MINAGMGANTKQAAANTKNPGPYPNLVVRGTEASGMNVPARHLVTSTAVIADAEYSSKASVT